MVRIATFQISDKFVCQCVFIAHLSRISGNLLCLLYFSHARKYVQKKVLQSKALRKGISACRDALCYQYEQGRLVIRHRSLILTIYPCQKEVLSSGTHVSISTWCVLCLGSVWYQHFPCVTMLT